MKKFNRNTAIVITLFTFINLTFSQSVFAVGKVVTPPATECFIEIENPHFSTFLSETNGVRAVKINASSSCNRPISSLAFTVEIFKKGFLYPHRVAKETKIVARVIKANEIIYNKNTYVKCKNSEDTTYFGKAYSEATIYGKHYKTLTVQTEKSISFKCGN